MAKQWAKLYRGATLREPLVELAQRNKLAFGLYFVLCAEADDFGRFTAHPAKFGHQVGGLIGVGPEEAEAILTDLEECGLIQRYEVDGEPFLAIIGYNDENEHQWLRMSGPEYPAPPGWVPPASFVEFVREHGHLSNVTPKRYALRPGISPECDELIALMSGTPVGTPAVTDVGTPAVTPVGTPVVTGMGTDSDSDSDSGTDSTAFNDVRLGPDVDLNQESVPSPQNDPGRQSDSSERLNDPFGPPLRQTTAEGQPPAPDGADTTAVAPKRKQPTYEEVMATFSDHERRLVNEALDLLTEWRPDGSRLDNARKLAAVRDLAPDQFTEVLAEGRKANEGRGPKTVKYYRTVAINAIQAPTASDLPQQWPKLRAAIGRLNIPPNAQDRWVRMLGNAIEGDGDPWVESEDQLVGLLAEYPPKAAEESLPGRWLERVEKARAPTRSGAYAVPHEWVGDEFEKLGFTR